MENFDPDNIIDPDEIYTPVSPARKGRRPGNRVEAEAGELKDASAQSSAESSRNSVPTAPSRRHGRRNRISSFFHDKRVRLFAGILSVCWGVYLLLAALSYFSHGSADQSLAMNLSTQDIINSGQVVENVGGPLGARMSHELISNGLGLGALVIIYYFLALGWCLLHRRPFSFIGLTLRCLVDAIAVSVVAGLLSYKFVGWFFLGGIHGYEINTYLLAHVGTLGTVLVSVLLIGIVVAIYLNNLRLLIVKWRRRRIARRQRTEAEREAREREEEMMRATLRQSDETLGNSAVSEPEEARRDVDDAVPAPDEDADTFPANEEPVQPSPVIVEFGGGQADEVVEVPSVADEVDVPDDEPTVGPAAEVTTIDDMDVKVGEIEVAKEIDTTTYDPTAELSSFRFPSIDLLEDHGVYGTSVDQSEMEENKERITATLNNYQIPISKITATVGPTVTLYEIVPDPGVRIARIKHLEDDIALSLAALGIRIIAPIPGKGTIGIEVPNKDPQMVPMRQILSSRKFQECKMELPMAFGATITRDIYIKDLAKMPHLLVAGATGMGKSVGLNVIIASLLYKKHPAELKFVLVDPKMVEFSLYSRLERHYLAKLPDEEEAIITDPMKVVATLNSLCVEMDQRYSLLKNAGVRTIKEYNAKFVQRRLNPEKGHRYLPYIVIVIDEFGDLIMVAGKEIENPITRLAQKARAVGMHLIMATQRPSTNVITGVIKANFPGRVAFRVASMVDSRTIIDRPGANQLIGKGDMLFAYNGEIDRVQCAFVSTDEVERIVESIDGQMGYDSAYALPDYVPESEAGGGGMASVNDRDPLFEEAARFIVLSSTASTSSLQRRYSIGYNRAGKIMDQLEAAGVVGPALGAKPRAVLVDSLQLERILEINNA